MRVKNMLKRVVLKSEIPFYLAVYLRQLLHSSNKDIKKFVLFAQGRSGSSLLSDLLNNHPEIRCDGEILNVRYRGKKHFPLYYVKTLAGTSEKPTYGFKVKIYQLFNNHNILHQDLDPKDFLTELYNSGWKIIWLTRNNIFRQAVSNFVLEARGKPHHRSEGELAIPKITIDPEKLFRSMRGREEHTKHEQEILEAIDHLKIIYETDLLENREDALTKIFGYLEVQPYAVKSSHRRTSKNDLSQYIVNYEEIVDFLSRTEYERFLTR